MSKTLQWLIILAVIAFGAAYFGSPYLAARQFREAALEANTDKLDATVDFPAVRESLKSQLSAAMMQKMTDDPAMKNNPFAGLGMMMAPAIVDRAVETFVTPDGLSNLIKGARAPGQAEPRKFNPDIEFPTEWVSLDRFRVHIRNIKSGEDGPSLLFERKGLFTWKLIRLEIPPSVFKDEVPATSSPPSGDGAPTPSATPSSEPTVDGDQATDAMPADGNTEE